MMHGVEMESLARNSFEELTSKTVQLCGLFTDNEFSYLAAGPDGPVGEDGILEIKCPFVAKDTLSATEAVQNKLILINEVEARKNLWDVGNEFYKDRDMRMTSWQDIAKTVVNNFENMSEIEKKKTENSPFYIN
ncbi:hypothetical protein QTP88_019408 [Uroleucon formosanum]